MEVRSLLYPKMVPLPWDTVRDYATFLNMNHPLWIWTFIYNHSLYENSLSGNNK